MSKIERIEKRLVRMRTKANETLDSPADLRQQIKAWKRMCSERGVETSCSCNGQSQTCHTRNDELGLTPNKDLPLVGEGCEQDGPMNRPSNEPNDRHQRLSPQNIQRDLDEETLVDIVAKSRWEPECWE